MMGTLKQHLAVTLHRLYRRITRRYWMDTPHPHRPTELHVYPNRDLIRHEADDCLCGPTAEQHHHPTGDRWIIMHHSLDGRELR